MQLPQGFPDNPRNAEAVHTLIDRVRKLEPSAKARLAVMLEEEMDLPYLDAMERQYADFFRKVAPENATSSAAKLGSRFSVCPSAWWKYSAQ